MSRVRPFLCAFVCPAAVVLSGGCGGSGDSGPEPVVDEGDCTTHMATATFAGGGNSSTDEQEFCEYGLFFPDGLLRPGNLWFYTYSAGEAEGTSTTLYASVPGARFDGTIELVDGDEMFCLPSSSPGEEDSYCTIEPGTGKLDLYADEPHADGHARSGAQVQLSLDVTEGTVEVTGMELPVTQDAFTDADTATVDHQATFPERAPATGSGGSGGGGGGGGGSGSCDESACEAYTNECESGTPSQAPCYCAAACLCACANDPCEEENRQSAESLGTTCMY